MRGVIIFSRLIGSYSDRQRAELVLGLAVVKFVLGSDH
jgi:hypothetical protein